MPAIRALRSSTCGAPARPAASTSTSTTRRRAVVLAAERHEGSDPLNLGTNHEVTIHETAETIARLVGFDGDLRWDPTKPDGQPRRRVDATRAETLLGWRAEMDFEQGLRATIDWYLANRAEAERVAA